MSAATPYVLLTKPSDVTRLMSEMNALKIGRSTTGRDLDVVGLPYVSFYQCPKAGLGVWYPLMIGEGTYVAAFSDCLTVEAWGGGRGACPANNVAHFVSCLKRLNQR